MTRRGALALVALVVSAVSPAVFPRHADAQSTGARITLRPAERPPGPRSGRRVRWRPGWRRFELADWVTTGVAGAAAITFAAVPASAERGNRLSIDEDARDTLRFGTETQRLFARDTSDVLLSLIESYDFLVDALIVTAWYRRSPDVATQMALIDTQALVLTAALQGIANFSMGRERPYGRTCEDGDTSRDCTTTERYRSFFSGHTSQSFASAALLCANHVRFSLYGGGPIEAVPCIAGFAAASTVGLLRVVGDQHYFSDVLTGAAIGTTVGFLSPLLLHYIHGAHDDRDDDDGVGALVGVENDPAWSRGRDRPFVSAAIDVGFLYLRPRAALGYGRPFHQWVGIEANPIFSTGYLGGYVGARGAIPSMDIRLGLRVMQQIRRSYLRPQEDNAFTRLDTEDRQIAGSALYLEMEAEWTASPRLGPGHLILVATGTVLENVPSGQLVYEDTLRVVANAPGILRGRIGYSLAFGVLGIGLVGEVVSIPGRDVVLGRGGLVVQVKLWRDLEVRLSIVPTLVSPDDLGVSGGDFGQLGVRWIGATGTR